ncbi:MAG: PilZ domain-containing protein [Byssovorax sp.]
MAARDHFRAHARRRVELSATLRGRDGSFEQTVRVRDLGLGGACLEVGLADDTGSGRPVGVLPGGDPRPSSKPSALEREAPVTIEVMAPTLWDPLVLSGKIAWIRRGAQGKPTRAGLRFEHREAGALYALFQLIGADVYDG